MNDCVHIWIYIPREKIVINGSAVVTGGYWLCTKCGKIG